jgi:hypothetical protein
MSRNNKEKGGRKKVRASHGTGQRRSHQDSRLDTVNKRLLGLYQSFRTEVRAGTVSKFAMVYERLDGTSFAFTSENLAKWVSDPDGMKELFDEAERGIWKNKRIKGEDLDKLQAKFPTLASGTLFLSLSDLRALLALLEWNPIRKSVQKKTAIIPAHMAIMLDLALEMCIDMGASEVAGLEGDKKDNDKEKHGSEKHSSASRDDDEGEGEDDDEGEDDEEDISQDASTENPRDTSGRWKSVRNAIEDTLLDYRSWQGPFKLEQRSGDEADGGRFLWVGDLMDGKTLPVSTMTRGQCLVALRLVLEWYNDGKL